MPCECRLPVRLLGLYELARVRQLAALTVTACQIHSFTAVCLLSRSWHCVEQVSGVHRVQRVGDELQAEAGVRIGRTGGAAASPSCPGLLPRIAARALGELTQ